MHLDVVELRAFYDRTGLGRIARNHLQSELAKLWPDASGLTVVGFGYSSPVLRPFLEHAERVINLMPTQQGVAPWPRNGPNTSTLVEETQWPLEAGSVKRLIVTHGLETCERPHDLLDEVWRVLAADGKVVFIVPNRAGLWARRDSTPFGYGRPYSLSQLETMLKRHRFEIETHINALYGPPSHRPFWLRTHRFWNGIGKRLHARFAAGVLMVEASKQVYVMPRSGLRETVRGGLEVLEGLAQPRPEPSSRGTFRNKT